MQPLDNVNITIEYPRPFYTFQDLNGEKGNPIHYWKDAVNTIYTNGFIKEAEEIRQYYSQSIGGMLLPQVAYEDQFNFLYRYLDFTKHEEKISEDEEYVYIKIKKENTINHITKQPVIFFSNNLKNIERLIKDGEDLSITNCYGRTILHYLDDVSSLLYFLEENKKQKWVDLFHLDVFNSTILHTHDNLYTFPILLNAMYQENPELTSKYFSGTDVFGQNASGRYLTLLDHKFNRKNQNTINDDEWIKFAECLKTIKLVAPEMHINILDSLTKMPIFKDCEKNPQGPQYKFYMYLLMESSLETKSQAGIKKHKI